MFYLDHPATKIFEKKYNPLSETLDLSGESLTGEDMLMLAEFLESHDSILKLVLDNNEVGSGLRYLTCKRITSFSIKNNQLTDEHIAQFARALLLVRGPKNNLDELDLADNQMSDNAATALALFDQPLSLYLDNNQIGIDGVKALSKNKKWFKSLSLSNNPLSDEAIQILKKRFNGLYGYGFFASTVEDQSAVAKPTVAELTVDLQEEDALPRFCCHFSNYSCVIS